MRLFTGSCFLTTKKCKTMWSLFSNFQAGKAGQNLRKWQRCLKYTGTQSIAIAVTIILREVFNTYYELLKYTSYGKLAENIVLSTKTATKMSVCNSVLKYLQGNSYKLRDCWYPAGSRNINHEFSLRDSNLLVLWALHT